MDLKKAGDDAMARIRERRERERTTPWLIRKGGLHRSAGTLRAGRLTWSPGGSLGPMVSDGGVSYTNPERYIRRMHEQDAVRVDQLDAEIRRLQEQRQAFVAEAWKRGGRMTGEEITAIAQANGRDGSRAEAPK